MPKSLVVDASFCVRLILPGPERNAFHKRMDQWLQNGHDLYAPDLWLYEMTSALCKAAFFGHVQAEEAGRSLSLVNELGVELVAPDTEQARRAYAWTRHLGRSSAYDSFYLALADTIGCELWTADRNLVNAAGLPWVRLA